MTHLPYPHMTERPWMMGLDLERGLLVAETCPCGAETIRPIDESVLDVIEAEYGVRPVPHEGSRAALMALTFDPSEREDLVSDVWPAAS